MVKPSKTYRDLSQRLLEDEWVADEIVIWPLEVHGSHHGQIDMAKRASLNGDTLALITFTIYKGEISNVRPEDFRGENSDPILMARLMLAVQMEFPGKYIPGLQGNPGYERLRIIKRPDFDLIKKIKRARALDAWCKGAEAAALAIEDGAGGARGSYASGK